MQYQKLAEEHRDSRRTIADAIKVLRQEAGFSKGDGATIQVGLMRLHSGQVIGWTLVMFAAPWLETNYCVSLPHATHFKGRRRGAPKGQVFDIIRLNRAKVDVSGKVILATGVSLQAVEVVPARLAEPTALEWRILRLALEAIKGGNRCYRSLREGLPGRLKEMVPDERFLDYSRLPELKPPPLKVIAIDIAKADPGLKVSTQKIADTLRKFGVRLPSSRPRRSTRDATSSS